MLTLMARKSKLVNKCPDCGNRGPWLPVVDKPGDPYPRELKCGTPDCTFTIDYRVIQRLPWIMQQTKRHPLMDEASE